MKFSELVRLLEKEGFRIIKEKGSIRYYGKRACPRLIRVDYHGTKGSAHGHVPEYSQGCWHQAQMRGVK